MNDNAPFQRFEGTSVDEAARWWFTHLRGDVSPAIRADFEAWRGASPANDAAYQQVEQDFAQAEILKTSSLYGSGRLQRSAGFPHHKAWIAGIAAVAATMIIVLLQSGFGQTSSPSQTLAHNTVVCFPFAGPGRGPARRVQGKTQAPIPKPYPSDCNE